MTQRLRAFVARIGGRLKSVTAKSDETESGDPSDRPRLLVLVLVVASVFAGLFTRDSAGYTEAERVAAASPKPATGEILVFRSFHDVSDSLKGMTTKTNGINPCAHEEELDPVLAEAGRDEEAEEAEEEAAEDEAAEEEAAEEGAESLSPAACQSEEEAEEEAERESALSLGDPDADPDADSDSDAEGDGDGSGAFSILSSAFPGADVEQKAFGPRPAITAAASFDNGLNGGSTSDNHIAPGPDSDRGHPQLAVQDHEQDRRDDLRPGQLELHLLRHERGAGRRAHAATRPTATPTS